MVDFQEYYKKENEGAMEGYEAGLRRIRNIVTETDDINSNDPRTSFLKFFNHTGRFILEASDLEKRLDKSYYEKVEFDVLKKENNRLFNELLPDYYENSYADPAFAVSQVGDRFGQALSFFYVQVRQAIRFSHQHKVFKLDEINRSFTDLYGVIRDGSPDYDAVSSIIIRDPQNPKVRDFVHELQENFSSDFGFLKDIVLESDLADLRYLFKYGRFISDMEMQNARFILEYPEEKIRKLTKQIANAYRTGFKRDNKDLSKKSTVRLSYSIGYERIIRYLMVDMFDIGLTPVIGNVFSKSPNRQYGYDHRFDAALYLDESYVVRAVHCFAEANVQLKEVLRAYSGIVHFDNFGEEPFVPEKKVEPLTLSKQQQGLVRAIRNRQMEIVEKYMPRSETSFTAISFPSPEIGEEFPKIFDEIYAVNMLDTEKYERMQQRIIDELDRAEYVHVKGRGSSETDIRVKMHPLHNPAKQTNFLNCGADVNIPVGEVFTSPVLKGTNGILHIEQTFLNGLRFDNLKLIFNDGYITEYSCTNYEKEEDNKKFIEDNLLFPHKSLPIGEFAIGTNTTAYAMSRKYGILRVLPILIIEKMGPHFAIGDTCFRHEEDRPVYNDLDGKEIIARENEKSSLRKEKPDEAYSYCHTDITIPYESIEFIAAITKEGKKIDIIRNGRFVVNGTEELNLPL